MKQKDAIDPQRSDRQASCCLCRHGVDPSGYCHECDRWPINVTPRRFHGDHPIDPDGFCWRCQDFMGTRLEAGHGEWRDTGRIARLLSKAENQRRARELAETLSGPGWPDKRVPLNVRFIPRRWKRLTLRKVGLTPNGDEIVIPETVADEVPWFVQK